METGGQFQHGIVRVGVVLVERALSLFPPMTMSTVPRAFVITLLLPTTFAELVMVVCLMR
jgi:hypothetical protein